MPQMPQPRELTASEVGISVDPAAFGFGNTADLEPLDQIVGQSRAMKALEIGLGIHHRGYHIYVAGLSGTGKMETIRRSLATRTRAEPTPCDWVYVNNFTEPDHPLAIELKPGQGLQLKRDMGNLIGRLLEELPKALKREDFEQEKKRLRHECQQRIQEIFDELQRLARKKGLAVQSLPDGQTIALPLREGRPITDEEAQQLGDAEREEIGKRQAELFEQAGELMTRQQELLRQLSADIHSTERYFANRVIEPLVNEIGARYESPKLNRWFQKLNAYLGAHFERFKEHGEKQVQQILGAELYGIDRHERFVEFQVNVVVDNSEALGAPVVIEDAPTYRNLFGTIDRVVDRHGRIVTNFTRIKAGSLLTANGGYLVFNLIDALTEPFVWKQLKRTLKSGSMQFDTYDPFALFSTTSLKPEAIPLTAKIVVLGSPLVYHLLYLYDDDFCEIFKVKADFADEMERDEEVGTLYGRFVRKLSEQEGVLPFEAAAVAELVHAGARLAAHQQKLTAEFSRLADLVRESTYWARQEGATLVAASHVRKAQTEQVFRSNLIADRIREFLADGTLRVTLDGRAVGQVNGLAVADLGDYAFGWPTRITASTGVGAAGIINVERESRLSGRTFDKGMLILEGYIRNQYARKRPVALSASLAMEQSYGGIDGDSASAAELFCLLSAIAEVPLRQDIAVTGSVNQWGQIQAVGGVIEKVEGYHDVCVQAGLTGRQGVCVPTSNAKNLLLRPDVVEHIRQAKFHVWCIDTVDEGLALLSGLPPGGPDEEQSFHWRVDQRLREMAALLKEQRAVAVERDGAGPATPVGAPGDPRPPLPGERS